MAGSGSGTTVLNVKGLPDTMPMLVSVTLSGRSTALKLWLGKGMTVL